MKLLPIRFVASRVGTLSPNPVKQGISFNRDEAIGEDYKSGSILLCFSRMVAASLLVLLLALGGCNAGKRITKANVDEVSEGMSKKQVESILGPPTSIDSKDFVVMKKTTYVYRQGKDMVTIVFKDDKLQSKDSTLSN
jgi:outer membrane protein assembly factor BamE (lipoprotein component of BamABCDE complex)